MRITTRNYETTCLATRTYFSTFIPTFFLKSIALRKNVVLIWKAIFTSSSKHTKTKTNWKVPWGKTWKTLKQYVMKETFTNKNLWMSMILMKSKRKMWRKKSKNKNKKGVRWPKKINCWKKEKIGRK